MQHGQNGRSRGAGASRRLAVVLAGALVTALAAATALSTAAVARTAAVPKNSSPPVITGNAASGQTLTVNAGIWTGTTPITFAYQWLRCDASGSNCASIAGETTIHRGLLAADVGHRLRVKVTAKNSSGSASINSKASPVVAVSASGKPASTKEPSISGSAVQGQTLTADKGAWAGTNPITYAYQWVRCDANAGSCGPIAKATTTSHVVTSDDVGHRLRIRITAANSAGVTVLDSNATGVVTATGGSSGPVNTALPVVTGKAAQGQSLVSTNGTWTGAAPITYTYQWVRCDATGANCIAVPGETQSNRVLTDGDVGHRMRIKVTAKNSAGSNTVDSAASEIVTGSGGTGGGTTPPSGPLPDGAVQLPSGKYSIPVTSVSLPTQLVVDKVKFSPNPVKGRGAPITVRVHVLDTRGYVVRDALVFVRTVPLVTTTPPEVPSSQDGWATVQVFPRAAFPLKNRGFVQFFVRVRKDGDTVLVGVGSRRLVQVRTAAPT